MATFSRGIHSLTIFQVGLLMGIIPRGGGSLIPSSSETNAIGETNGILQPLSFPCPDPHTIFPCVCSYEEDQGMDMDCSSVTGEEELREVFSQEFPFKNFRMLTIDGNKHITILRKGDLGNASFTKIYLMHGVLTETENLALMGSWATLTDLVLHYNELDNFPDIWAFSRLTKLSLYNNNLTQFPFLKSETLTSLNLGVNSINIIPPNLMQALPQLQEFYFGTNPLHEIYSGTFSFNEHLKELNLDDNQLTTIPRDAIRLHGGYTRLSLYDNQLASLPYETISGVTDYLHVAKNQLTELPEKVYRPLLEKDVTVYLYENPFICGCDIAWLIENQTLLMKLPHVDSNYTSTPRCSDGVRFIDLDPAVYHAMCDNVMDGF